MLIKLPGMGRYEFELVASNRCRILGRKGWYCTRTKGHPGPHQSQSRYKLTGPDRLIFTTWEQEC